MELKEIVRMEKLKFMPKIYTFAKSILLIGLSIQLTHISAESSELAVPGQLPPEYIQNQVRPLLNEVRNAQQKHDIEAINQNINSILKTLGSWAGNPDLKPTYLSPIETTQPSSRA